MERHVSKSTNVQQERIIVTQRRFVKTQLELTFANVTMVSSVPALPVQTPTNAEIQAFVQVKICDKNKY